MIAFCLSGACVDGLVKIVTSNDFPSSEVIFLRSIIGCLVLLPLLLKKKLLKISKQALPLYIYRGIFTFVAVAIWFYILQFAPLTKLMAIGFSSTLFTTFLAIIFLKEYYDRYSLLSLAIGFIGALIIIRPGFVETDIYLALALISAFFWAMSLIATKKLSSAEHPIKISFYVSLIFIPLSLTLGTSDWYVPSQNEWYFIVTLAIFGAVGQIFLAESFHRADLVILMPFEFFTLIFAAIFAYFAFGEIIDKWTIAGAVIILSSAYAVIFTQKRKSLKEEIETVH